MSWRPEKIGPLFLFFHEKIILKMYSNKYKTRKEVKNHEKS